MWNPMLLNLEAWVSQYHVDGRDRVAWFGFKPPAKYGHGHKDSLVLDKWGISNGQDQAGIVLLYYDLNIVMSRCDNGKMEY